MSLIGLTTSKNDRPMGLGSTIGAIFGKFLVGLIPGSILKVLLGIILNLSTFKVFLKTSPKLKKTNEN